MSSSVFNRLVSYYRSCYQLDAGSLQVSHAFAKTNGLYVPVDTLEPFRRDGSLYPLPTDIGKAFEASL